MKEYDVVVLLTDDVEEIPQGSKGTVLYNYEDSGMVLVEFMDSNYKTIGIKTIFKSALKIV